MTALIWMLAWLPLVLPAMSKLPQPVNMTLSSLHFIHVLKWEAGPGTPTGVHYHVSVHTVWGTSWVPVAGCEHVQHPLVCNLTEAFSNPNESYYTKIKAVLDTQHSEPVTREDYKPIRDADMDLPLLTVTPCGRDLCVDLQPPMEHLKEIYDSLQYTLRIKSNNTDKAQFRDTKSLGKVLLTDLVSGRVYCVSVCLSDKIVPRRSNYSQPVCASTPGFFTADPWIAALLILLVMFVLVLVALLVFSGFICLRRRSLPSVLEIHHIEGVVVVPSCKTSLSSLLDINPTAPSSGEKRTSQTSDDSDAKSETESTGGSRGGGYKLRRGTNLLSSSSSSPSLLSALLCPEPEPLLPSFSSNQTPSDLFHPQPEPSVSAETHSCAGLKDSLPISEPSSDPRPADADLLTVGKIQPVKAEEKVAGDGGSQDVNLFTLTFGTDGEEKEEESHLDVAEVETESSSASEVYRTIPTPPSQNTGAKDVSIATVSYSDEDEEDDEVDELSGYMRRP